MGRSQAVPRAELVEALLANDALYALGELIPETARELGGRPRHYPAWSVFFFNALITVFRSARAAEAELGHPWLWERVRTLVEERFPNSPEMWLPETPMRRYHYAYMRDRYLTDDETWSAVRDSFTTSACSDALELGLFDPAGAGSFNHPDLARTLYGDGKCVTPLYKGREGHTVVDKATGEIRQPKFDPDARSMKTGGKGSVMGGKFVKNTVFGSKFVIVAARTDDKHGRLIFDVDHSIGNTEVNVALECLERIAPQLPGAQAFLYDGAFRGAHLDATMTRFGLVPIAPPIAKKAADEDGNGRIERRAWVEDVVAKGGNGRTLKLYADGGALGLIDFNEKGEEIFVYLARTNVRRRSDKIGHRFYGEYIVPTDFGGGTVTIRFNTTKEDRAKGFNRSENVRVVPPTHPDYKRLYPRRADIESINRGLEDSLFLGRAHSVGKVRQRIELLGYALVVNSLAMFRAIRSKLQRGRPAA